MWWSTFLACTDPCVPLEALEVDGDEDVRAAVLRALNDFDAGTGTSTCLSEVKLGQRASLEHGVLTVTPDRLRADVFAERCRELDRQRGYSAAHPDWFPTDELPPGFSGAEAGAEAFARACGRVAAYPLPAYLDALSTCGGTDPEPRDRFFIELFGRDALLPAFPTTSVDHGAVRFEHPVAELAFTSELAVFVERIDVDDYSEPTRYRVNALGLPGLVPLWQQELPPSADFYQIRVSSVAEGVVVFDFTGGQIWLASRAGLTELASAPPFSIRSVIQGRQWWITGSPYNNRTGIRAYDPESGVGPWLDEAGGGVSDLDGIWRYDDDAWVQRTTGYRVSETPYLRYLWFAAGRVHAQLADSVGLLRLSRRPGPGMPWELEELECEPDIWWYEHHAPDGVVRWRIEDTEDGRTFGVQTRVESQP